MEKIQNHNIKNLLNVVLLVIILATLPVEVLAQQIDEQARKRAKELVAQMTLREKIDYLSGETSFSLRAIPRLGIPRILLADGPCGTRNHSEHSTLYPCGILTAATWNRDMAYLLGEGLGDDSRARGVGILLGPGVNIYRSPLCGRNYEYFGEDPFLTSEIACQYIKGVQDKGVIATIKHFCGNNQEWSRHHASSDIDERTLQEIYFPAFRKAVQNAHVGAVMDSYNLVNGVHATENAWLNKTILRDTWGFQGILMSDWTSVYSVINTANHGLDLEMPKGRYLNYENLYPAIQKGLVTEATIDLKVQHILQTLISFGLLDREQKIKALPLDNPESRNKALQVAREGVVLLKNENQALPLKGRTALVGENANMIATGGGSGFVSPYSSTTLSKALKKMKPNLVVLTDDIIFEDVHNSVYVDKNLTQKGFLASYYKNQKLEGKPDSTHIDSRIAFDWGYDSIGNGFPKDHFSASWSFYYKAEEDGLLRVSMGGDDGYRLFVDDHLVTGDWGNHSYSSREKTFKISKGKVYHFLLEYFDNISSASVRCDIARLNEKKLYADLDKVDNIVYCTGFNSNVEGEGFDRPFALNTYQEEMIDRLSREKKKLTVVLNAGGGVDLNRWVNKVDGLLMAWYPGQEGGTALAEILMGKISPSGKLPISIERKWEDNPCHDSYYENRKGRECKTIEYNEGVFVGYRGYDANGIKPLFSFGYGLSYSTFEYSNLNVKKKDNVWEASFDVTNTGKIDASEVAQLYVGCMKPSVVRPQKELKGFEKIKLKKGETKHIHILLDSDAFSHYDMDSHQFVTDPGDYRIWVGGSSDSLPLEAKIRL